MTNESQDQQKEAAATTPVQPPGVVVPEWMCTFVGRLVLDREALRREIEATRERGT